MQHPDILDIIISEDQIEVLTRPINIKYRNKTYSIGSFKIVLSTDPKNWLVRMFNLTRMIRQTHHPHVNSEGQPCLGNINECLPNMIADRQFVAAISVCIQYLKSINDGGHLSKIDMWPVLHKAKEKRGNEGKTQK